MQPVIIINYNAGNIKSVTNALDRIGVKWKVTSDSKEVGKASKIIMPGVGSAKAAMEELRKRELIEVIRNTAAPFLGICLGMQVLFEWSEEGDVPCLGVIKGRVRKFRGDGLKVPHIGWNIVQGQKVNERRQSGQDIFGNTPDGTYFYFVHSYYCEPESNEVITATTNYGIEFASAVQYRNFYCAQFHPEKSGKTGLEALKAFCDVQ